MTNEPTDKPEQAADEISQDAKQAKPNKKKKGHGHRCKFCEIDIEEAGLKSLEMRLTRGNKEGEQVKLPVRHICAVCVAGLSNAFDKGKIDGTFAKLFGPAPGQLSTPRKKIIVPGNGQKIAPVVPLIPGKGKLN